VKEEAGVAAFFDLDGTLVELPSLEQRLFRTLRYQRAIGVRNYFLWCKEALRLLPRGITAILHANKMYLRGVQSLDERGEGDGYISSRHKDGHQAEGQASCPARSNSRLPVPTFFPRATERVAWHARQGHEIVIVSGTLEALARGAAHAMEAELAARGIAVTIRVRGTRLEEKNGALTGMILGEAMFGEEKARAAQSLASELRLELARCYAYGDTANDRSLLELVGKPAAVNPSAEFASMARTRRWPILDWEEKEIRTQRRGVRREGAEKKEQRSAVA
jgi:HAD superfamily hydrolase (TIGR01490 family)